MSYALITSLPKVWYMQVRHEKVSYALPKKYVLYINTCHTQ